MRVSEGSLSNVSAQQFLTVSQQLHHGPRVERDSSKKCGIGLTSNSFRLKFQFLFPNPSKLSKTQIYYGSPPPPVRNEITWNENLLTGKKKCPSPQTIIRLAEAE